MNNVVFLEHFSHGRTGALVHPLAGALVHPLAGALPAILKKNIDSFFTFIKKPSVWVSVCLYPINVKTAEPIRSKFCVGPHVAPGQVYEWSKFQIFVYIKIRLSLIFSENFENLRNVLLKSANFFVLFTMYTKRTCSQWK